MNEGRGLVKPLQRFIAVVVLSAPWSLLGDHYGCTYYMASGLAADSFVLRRP